MTQEKNVESLKINKLTSAQYNSITPSDTELYFITDDDNITSEDIIEALGYTPYNASNPNGYTSNTGTITGITMNGSSKGTSGIVNLGTVITEHQDISGKADKSTTLSGYGITDAYTKTEVDSKLSAVYKFKGTVESIDSLPSSGNTVGDVYNVEDTGANYAWTETGWDKLSETIDLSGLEQISNKVTSISSSSTDTQYPSAKCVYDAIQAGGSVVDQTYSPASTNAQSGTAVAQAVATKTQVIFRDWGAS